MIEEDGPEMTDGADDEIDDTDRVIDRRAEVTDVFDPNRARVDANSLNASWAHKLRVSDVPALDQAATTGMIKRPDLSTESPAPPTDQVDMTRWYWWQTEWMKFTLGLLIGLLIGILVTVVAHYSDDIVIIEPLQNEQTSDGSISISITKEESKRLNSLTSTMTFAEFERVLCQQEPQMPALIKPTARRAYQLQKVQSPLAEPAQPVQWPCRGRTGSQNIKDCCEVSTHHLPNYESEWLLCTQNPENWFPSTKGDSR